MSAGASDVKAYHSAVTVTPDQAWSSFEDWPTTSGNETVDDQLEKGRRKGRLLPLLSVLGAVGIGATVVDQTIGWRFCLEVSCPGTGWIYRKITGDNYAQSEPGGFPYGPMEWEYFGPSFGEPESTWKWGVYIYGNFNFAVCAATAGCNNPETIAATTDSLNVPEPQTRYFFESTACNQGTGGACAMVLRTAAEMEQSVQTEPITEAEYDALTKKISTGTYIPPVATSEDKQAALDAAIGTTTQTPSQQATEEYLCEQAYGGGATECEGSPDTFTLPAPTANETYTEYVTRLQALGYVGTITSTELATALEGYGPSAPARVIVPGSTPGTTRTLDPLVWPNPSPILNKTDNITLRYNPSTVAPAPTPDDSPCNCPPIDFGPLFVGTTDKMPFGIIPWIKGFFDQFGTTGVAPTWTLTMPYTSSTMVIAVPDNSNIRAIGDPIMKVIVVLASIYFLATWFFGFGKGDRLNDGE